MAIDLIIKNKKAYFDYEILEEYEAGIILQGSEVKSLRNGQCNVTDAYADIITANNGEEEVWLKNFHISEYKNAGKYNHKPTRERKLLLHKREIKKLIGKIKQKGFSLIPLELYFNNKGLVKLKLGLGRGKSKYDKRETIKEKDWQREKQRNFKNKQ